MLCKDLLSVLSLFYLYLNSVFWREAFIVFFKSCNLNYYSKGHLKIFVSPENFFLIDTPNIISSMLKCLSSVKQIASPGWMHETSARGWCTGMTQRDGMGREVGGGFRMGTHVNLSLIHVNVWQKPLQYCKVISLQLIKINGKKIFLKLLFAIKK